MKPNNVSIFESQSIEIGECDLATQQICELKVKKGVKYSQHFNHFV
jgi:hypothetical protein